MDMALRDQPYLPLYVQDFLTDEKLAECSASATGVYIRLLCLMHKSETYGEILLRQKHKQTDDQILNFAIMFAKVMPFDTECIYNGIKELVEENVVQLSTESLSQKRMIKDHNLSVIRSESGRKGGINRFKTGDNFAIAKTQANTEIESDNENDINTLHNQKKEINVEFEIFWDLYDKKVGPKEKLVKKWENLTAQERIMAMEHIPKYKFAQPEKKYRKDPSTYLNQKSFNDEIIQSNGKQGSALNGRNFKNGLPTKLDSGF